MKIVDNTYIRDFKMIGSHTCPKDNSNLPNILEAQMLPNQGADALYKLMKQICSLETAKRFN